MRTLLFFALTAALTVRSASAQANPDSTQHRNDCSLAEQVVATGNPEGLRAWAGSEIHACGPDVFSRAALSALQRLRGSSDTAALNALWGSALLHVNSRSVFDAGLQIAADPSAAARARVFAFTGLIQMLKPQELFSVETLTRTDRVGHYRASWCSDGLTAGIRQWVIGLPVDGADAVIRLRQVGDGVVHDATAPPDVQAAALCAARL